MQWNISSLSKNLPRRMWGQRGMRATSASHFACPSFSNSLSIRFNPKCSIAHPFDVRATFMTHHNGEP